MRTPTPWPMWKSRSSPPVTKKSVSPIHRLTAPIRCRASPPDPITCASTRLRQPEVPRPRAIRAVLQRGGVGRQRRRFGSATAITITAGVTKTGSQRDLAAGGAISGRVTDSSSDGLANVRGRRRLDRRAAGMRHGDDGRQWRLHRDRSSAGTQTLCFDAARQRVDPRRVGMWISAITTSAGTATRTRWSPGANAVTVRLQRPRAAINATLASSASDHRDSHGREF